MKVSASYSTQSLIQDIQRQERSKIYQFDQFELSTLPLRLTRAGKPITLQPQPSRALKLLVEHRGGVVTREMLREHLWGKGTFLDHEQGINFALRKIRIALGDSPSAPRFIETVPRLGYRFVAFVHEAPGAPLTHAEPIQSPERRPMGSTDPENSAHLEASVPAERPISSDGSPSQESSAPLESPALSGSVLSGSVLSGPVLSEEGVSTSPRRRALGRRPTGSGFCRRCPRARRSKAGRRKCRSAY